MSKATRRSSVGLHLEEGLTTKIGSFNSKFSLPSFVKRVTKLNNYQRNQIEKTGFGCLLLLPNHKLSKIMLAEVMARWNCQKRAFFLTPDLNELRITLLDVALILGLPVRGNPVVLKEEYPFSELEREYASLPEKRHIVVGSLEKRLDSIGEAAGEDFVRTFLLFTFGTFLFPNTSGKVDSRYLHYLEDLNAVSKCSWGAAVLEDMFVWLDRRKETNADPMGGCLILLQIWCYEHINIARPDLVVSGLVFPRVCRWETTKCHKKQWFTDKFKELQDDQITWELEPTDAELEVKIIKDSLKHCGEADESLTSPSSSGRCSVISVVEVLSNLDTNISDIAADGAIQVNSEPLVVPQNAPITQHITPDCPSTSCTSTSNEDYLILENQKLVEKIAELKVENEKLSLDRLENVELKKEIETLRRETKEIETLRRENNFLKSSSFDFADRLDRILLGEDLNDSEQ